MLALACVTLFCLYLIGQRADRIHAQRSGGSVVGSSVRSVTATRLVSRPVPARGLYRGKSAAYWAGRYRHRTRQLQQARRVLLSRPSVAEAINLAGATYGYTDTLWRKARCESQLDPNARNGSEASGLLQFLPSTWATTPYARFSIFSPYANALAAGWMHAQGRGGEWSCR